MSWDLLSSTIQQKVLHLVESYEMPYSISKGKIEGLPVMFEPSDGISSVDLEKSTIDLIWSSRLPMQTQLNPIFDLDFIAHDFINKRRLAAFLRCAWTRGRVGFPLLPNPREENIDSYYCEALRLLSNVQAGGEINPQNLLTNIDNRDLDFYNSLPDNIKVYRGTNGICAEQSSYGVCWTTRQDIAEWFALRFASKEDTPILLEAEISKNDIATVFAHEHEIVVMPDISYSVEFKYSHGRDGSNPRPNMQAWGEA